MQNMLRPIVEAAGYRVVGEGDEAEADVVILSDAAPAELGPAARTIRLRSDPEGQEDGSVYRYDRAGLLVALKSVGRG